MKYVITVLLAIFTTACTIVPVTPTIHVKAPRMHIPVPVVVMPGRVYRHDDDDWDD